MSDEPSFGHHYIKATWGVFSPFGLLDDWGVSSFMAASCSANIARSGRNCGSILRVWSLVLLMYIGKPCFSVIATIPCYRRFYLFRERKLQQREIDAFVMRLPAGSCIIAGASWLIASSGYDFFDMNVLRTIIRVAKVGADHFSPALPLQRITMW